MSCFLDEASGGVSGDLCIQDFDSVFDALGGAVVASAELSCEWEIPDPPDDQILDPDLVNVVFSDGAGGSQSIGRVGALDDCDRVAQGWYYAPYSSPALPDHIRVCPQTCEMIQGHPGATIELLFGCESDYEPLI